MPFSSSHPVPSEWDITYALSMEGEPHCAIITRAGGEMHRLEVPGTAMSGRAALIELHARAEAWIWAYLLRTGVM